MKYLFQMLAVGMTLAASPACATVLLGATVTAEYRFPDVGTPYPDTTYDPQTFVVGAGQESAVTIEDVTTFNVDFSDTALTIDFDTVLMSPTFASTAFNGLVFTSLDFSEVSSVTISDDTNLAGFDLSRVLLVGDELRLDFSGLGYTTNTFIGLNFRPVQAVPEPTTWAMMLVGFGALGMVLRRNAVSIATVGTAI